jgi:hypothetical protein
VFRQEKRKAPEDASEQETAGGCCSTENKNQNISG